MSRLIVKNLPSSITPEKIKEIFGEKGRITDVQLKYTKDGVFRKFGFVGYRTPEEASSALQHFDKTCINASQIHVEVCSDLGGSNRPKAWSKYAPDSTAYKKRNEKQEPKTRNKEKKKKKKLDDVVNALEKHKSDPMFAEFLEAHGQNNVILNNKSGSEIEEEEEEETNENGDETNRVKDTKSKTAKKNISDAEYLKTKIVSAEGKDDVAVIKKENSQQKDLKYGELYTVVVRNLANGTKKKDIKQLFRPLKPKTIRIPPHIKGLAYAGFASEKERNRALMKHFSFLGGKRITVIKCSNTVNKKNTVSQKWKEQEEQLKHEETVAESGRIFVRNLAYTITEEELTDLFSKYGPIAEVTFPIDKSTRQTKGFAIITFVVPENASKAYTELDGSVFCGRMLHLIPGKAKETLEDKLEKDGLTYKEKQALLKKSQAAAAYNWNTLFLGQNAVANIISDTYNTSKEKVLDSSGKESVATRLALGETQIVYEIRNFLDHNGVYLDAFNQPPRERSKTVILAKNLPAQTSDSEIRQLFVPFGELGRVLLPPSGVTAIIEFLEPSEARNAFKTLAYRKFKHMPLYLEWAPANTFVRPYEKKPIKTEKTDVQEAEISQTISKSMPEPDPSESEDEEPEPDTTLFIKNLNFTTRDDAIIEHFKKCGKIHYAKVATKKDPKNPGQLLSLGYAFLQFKNKSSADKALKSLQQSVIDGFSIEIKRSNRVVQSEVKTARRSTKIGKQTGTKILVKNIPFQATVKEVTELFKTFGELKAVRLPKKMSGTGTHRGFAFIDYHTKHDAKRAFNALSQSTHLYGRRLVLEWAATTDEVDEIRKRTAKHFAEEPSKSKNLRKSTVDPLSNDSD